jgi:hypothetical protein
MLPRSILQLSPPTLLKKNWIQARPTAGFFFGYSSRKRWQDIAAKAFPT